MPQASRKSYLVARAPRASINEASALKDAKRCKGQIWLHAFKMFKYFQLRSIQCILISCFQGKNMFHDTCFTMLHDVSRIKLSICRLFLMHLAVNAKVSPNLPTESQTCRGKNFEQQGQHRRHWPRNALLPETVEIHWHPLEYIV